MDFLNRVKEAALDVAGKTEKKSKEIYSVAKLRLAIADKQSEGADAPAPETVVAE